MAIAVRPVFLRRWQILPIRFLIRLFVQIITVDKNNIKMWYYDRTDFSEGIDVNKTSAVNECVVCHY